MSVIFRLSAKIILYRDCKGDGGLKLRFSLTTKGTKEHEEILRLSWSLGGPSCPWWFKKLAQQKEQA